MPRANSPESSSGVGGKQMTRDTRLYFAYGSNMHEPRLRERVPSAEFVDIARLPGMMVVFQKHGRDDSAKCDLEPLDSATSWGVVYRIDVDDLPRLDEAEGDGYRRESVVVATRDDFLEAFTYRARKDHLTSARPFDWYVDLLVEGARDHDLPQMYIAGLEQTETQPDPDSERAERNRP